MTTPKIPLTQRVRRTMGLSNDIIKYRAFPGLTWGSSQPQLDGFGDDWYKPQIDAGIPVNALGVNNAGPLWEIQDYSEGKEVASDNILTWRDSLWSDMPGGGRFNPNNPNYMNNPEDEADSRYAYKYDVRWPSELDKTKVYLKDENETRTKLADDGSESMWENLTVGEWQGRYNLQFAQNAVRDNRRVMLLSISSGDHDEIFWDNPSMIRFLIYAAEHREHVIISLHEYSYVGENLFALVGNDDATWQECLAAPAVDRKVGRFLLLYDFLDKKGLKYVNVYHAEFGWDMGAIPQQESLSIAQTDIFWERFVGGLAEYHKGYGTWYSDDWQGHKQLKHQVNALFPGYANLVISKEYEAIRRVPSGGGGPIDPPPIDPDPPIEDVMFPNSCFSEQWNTLQPSGNQEPGSWTLAWAQSGEKTPRDITVTGTPECVHKLNRGDQLPPDQQLGGSDALILCGPPDETAAVFKCFGMNRVWYAIMTTFVPGLITGREYKITSNFRVHYHSDVNEDDHFTIQLNGDTYHTRPDLPDQQWVALETIVKADSGGIVNFVVQMYNDWETTEDVFMDQFTIALVPIVDPPPIDPPPSEDCKGLPRTQYRRLVNVAMHTHTTPEQRLEIYTKAAQAGESAGPSADDGGIGDLKDKTVVLWQIPNNEHTLFLSWYAEHYPGTKVGFKMIEEAPPVNPIFKFTDWPTQFLKVNQEFGANPQNYEQFNLPGHDGVDIEAPHGTKLFAVAPGVVSNIIPLSQGSAYGLGVRISHGHFIEDGESFEYETTYAHCAEILVNVGDSIAGGGLIALADNTGNSFGSHLHMTLKKKFATLTDQFGTWPYNLHDPTWLLNDLGLDVSWPGGSPGIPPVIPPPVTSPTDPGLHASADSGDGVFLEQVLQEFRTLKPGVVKFLSSHSPAMIASVAADNKTHISKYIIRAFLSWGSRDISPDQFCNDTIPDVQRSVNALIGQGILPQDIGIELHNEMNLALEGSWHSWQNGYECGAFFNNVIAKYKIAMPPNVKYGLGGLSPGGFITGVRLESTQFTNEMIETGVYDKMDYNYVHVYTVDDWEGPYEMSWVNFNLSILDLPIYITESSYHTPVGNDGHRIVIHGTDYASRLNRLLTKLDATAVKGVTFYCASASNRDFRHESWVISEDPATPYANAEIRGIATALRHQRPL